MNGNQKAQIEVSRAKTRWLSSFSLLALLFLGWSFEAKAMTTLAGNPVPAASVCAGSTQVPIQSFFATGNGLGNNITAVGFTANGTWVSADISTFRLWTTTGSTFTSPTQIAVTNTQTFSGFSVSTKNTTVYFWITMDVTLAATDGRTLTVAAMTNVIGSNSGTAPASGTQTLRNSVGGTA